MAATSGRRLRIAGVDGSLQAGRPGLAWWLVPTVLFPIALIAMVIRKELTGRTLLLLVLLSAVLAAILRPDASTTTTP